jgi:CIC family chloride channel protein
MGAVFAASAQAPLTAIVIILEMTGDYGLSTAVMAACVLSYLVYSALQRDSMYTVKLSRNGVRILRGSDVRPLQALPVSAAMVPAEPTVRMDTPLGEAGRLAMENGRQALVVLDRDGLVAGTVDGPAIFEALAAGRSQEPVSRVARTAPRTLFPDVTHDEAMRRFQLFGASMIPVVDRAAPRRVVGALTYEGAVGAYDLHTTHNLNTSARIRQLHGLAGHEGDFRELGIAAGSRCIGRAIADLGLPSHVSIVSVMRGGDVLVAHDSTVLQAGDRILVFAAPGRYLDDVPALLGLPAAARGPRAAG